MFDVFRSSCVHRLCLLLLIAFGLSGFAQNAGNGTQPASSGQQTQGVAPAANTRPHIHIVPWGTPSAELKAQNKAAGKSSNNGIVQYFGGPVISNVQVVEVLWGNLVATSELNGPAPETMDTFYTDVTQSNYFSLLAEYATVGLTAFDTGAPGSNQTIGPGTFGGKFPITPSVCPGTSPCTITDAQIQNEIVTQLNAGHLPTPVQDGQGNFNTIYMIYFPPNVSIELDPQTFSCQQGGFCAYHSDVSIFGKPKLPYGVFPDFSQGGCGPLRGGCGDGGAFQNLTGASSHELGEAVTDTEAGSGPLAWDNQNAGQFSGFEIGDFCNRLDASITVNGNTYNVQTQLSNMQGACVSAPGNFTVTPSTTNAVPLTQFQVTVQPEGIFGSLQAYNNTVHFTSTDPQAVLPADYTFVPGTDNGSHTFNVTLKTPGMQTVSVNDTIVTKMIGQTPGVNIQDNPDLIVSSTHTPAKFTQSDVGDTYTLTVTNQGDRSTSGMASVTDTLPSGLTATAMSGSGWSCTINLGSSGTCTSSAVIGAGGTYPSITLTVNVANNAGPTLTNTVTVAGGGEANTSNDSATDPTTVIQLPDMTISKAYPGDFSQGQINANYTLTVTNVGFATSSGTVTVTDTLPMGLTAASAMSGTGWSCSALPALTCTRSDALAASVSYPPITLTVNVDPTAPSSVTNTATVSGGGQANTNNDTATLTTTVTMAAPDLIIASSHSGNFTQGQVGAAYTLTVSNIGPLATTMGTTVTVTDNLPGFMTVTGMSGTGWTCITGFTFTCTRSDVLGGYIIGPAPPSYPPITLTVNILNTAPSPLTNTANVFMPGELDVGNNSTSDATVVVQLADLAVSQSASANFVQGITGATYILNVFNNSFTGSTIGTVTVSDALPSALTATAIAGNGWNCTLSNLTCTRGDVLGPNGSYPPVTVTVNIASNAPASVTNTATVSGGGEVITNNDTFTLTSQISPPVTLFPVSVSATVKAGGAANYQVNVLAPLPGSMQAACSSGLPAGANCNIFPSTFTAPFGGPVTISISTTGALGSVFSGPRRRQLPLYAALIPGIGLMLLLAGGRRRRVWRALIGAAGLVLLFTGCGRGGSSGPPITPTPAGTYTVTMTVTNTTANTQSSTPLTLTVQ